MTTRITPSTVLPAAALLLLTAACNDRMSLDFPIRIPEFDAGFAISDAGTLPPELGPVVKADKPPPPIAGGTLLVSDDARWAFASDPDRDRIHVVDLDAQALSVSLALNENDEPGRAIQDGEGRVHVVLRRAGAIVTVGRDLDSGAWSLLARRPVCAVPRGVDHEAGKLYVACAEGLLVVLSADPTGGIENNFTVARDVRDVVVTPETIFLSRFRSAEILLLNRDGSPRKSVMRLAFTLAAGAPNSESGAGGSSGMRAPGVGPTQTGVAWRMRRHGDGVVVLHQRASTQGVSLRPGGYGDVGGCGGLVSAGIVRIDHLGNQTQGATITSTVLAVDFSLSGDGQNLVLVAPGNALTPGLRQAQLQMYAMGTVLGAPCITPPGVVPPGFPMPPPPFAIDAGVPPVFVADAGVPTVDGGDAGATDAGTLPPFETVDFSITQPTGVAIGVAVDRRGRTLVQLREPARLLMANTGKSISLSTETRADTGHDIFHSNAGAGIACASCHPEGGEDSLVWNFLEVGPRRTQSLRGRVLKTAPFHWDGEFRDVGALMTEVFQKRMSGPVLSTEQIDTLAHWVDGIPAMSRVLGASAEAMAHGKALFEGAAGCSACHVGANLTNNQNVNVGTGGLFQVPSLRGLRWRDPYMHTGCLSSLSDRFKGDACSGTGNLHGTTTTLSATDVKDLAAYLDSL